MLQVTQLLEAGQFETAISMCTLLEPKLVSQEQKSLHGLYACNLFSKGDFKSAFHHFGLSDAEPVSVVALVPDLLPPYVPQPPAPCNVPMPALVKSLLSEATTCAVAFLEAPRSGELSDEVVSVLDTALLKALLVLGKEQEAMALLAGTNCCHLEESARLLERHQRPLGLVALYSSHKVLAACLWSRAIDWAPLVDASQSNRNLDCSDTDTTTQRSDPILAV